MNADFADKMTAHNRLDSVTQTIEGSSQIRDIRVDPRLVVVAAAHFPTLSPRKKKDANHIQHR